MLPRPTGALPLITRSPGPPAAERIAALEARTMELSAEATELSECLQDARRAAREAEGALSGHIAAWEALAAFLGVPGPSAGDGAAWAAAVRREVQARAADMDRLRREAHRLETELARLRGAGRTM